MSKTWLIISREYITRVRKKSFIFFTLLGPVFFLFISILPVLISQSNNGKLKILVKDESGLITALPDTAGLYFTFKYNSENLDFLKENFASLDDGYDAILYIPQIAPDAPYGIEIYSEKQMGLSTRVYLENIIADKLEEINLINQNLSKQQILKLRPSVSIDDKVSSGSKQKEGDAMLASFFGYGMGFMIYIVLLIYGTMVMRSVMEEKNSRIVEVIISSVKPFQLMMGKIIGVGLVGLTQFVAWGFLITILNIIIGGFFGGQIAEFKNLAETSGDGGEVLIIAQALESLSAHPIYFYLGIFLVYFLGGYFIYAALFAAIGSLAGDDDTNVQMYALPVTLLILASIFIMMSVVQQPHTQLAFWTSIIPLTSPVVMPALVPFGVPGWQIALSIGLLILGFIFTTMIAARIYRTGILLYGKKIKFKEIWRWIRYKY